MPHVPDRMAAERAGLKRVILPHENEQDLDELPEETGKALQFVSVDSIEDVLEAAFADGRGRLTRTRPVELRQAAKNR